jgi:hypothetical protein
LDAVVDGNAKETFKGQEYPFKYIGGFGITSPVWGTSPTGFIYNPKTGMVKPHRDKFLFWTINNHLDDEWVPIEDAFSGNYFVDRTINPYNGPVPVKWVNNLVENVTGWSPWRDGILPLGRGLGIFQKGGKMNTQELQQQIVQLVQAAM